MATFWTDFSEYTDGAQPSDWTERWNTGTATATVTASGAPGGVKALRIAKSAVGRYALSWNDVGTPSGDVEVLAKMYRASGAGIARAIYVHGSGGGADSSGYSVFEDTATSDVELGKNVSGSYTVLQEDTSEPLSAGTWVWFRLQRTGTTIRVRWWNDGVSEPGAWNLSASDSSLSSGWVSVGAYDATPVVWVGQFSVGTGGDPAPMTGNEAPTAAAGTDQTVDQGDVVELDGTGSSDPDGDALTYSWSVLDDGGTGLTASDFFRDAAGDAALSHSPTHFWRLDDTSGDFTDSGSGGAELAVTGTVDYATADFNGKPAAVFGSGRAALPGAYNPGAQNTISFWAKIEPGEWAQYMTPVAAGSNTWDVRFDGLQQMRCHRVTTVTNRNIDITPSAPVDDGLWHHYCVVFDAVSSMQMRVYFDGNLEAQTTLSAGEVPNTGANQLAVGASGPTGGRDFHGAIAQVMSLDAELTTSQVQAIYNAGVADESAGSESASPKFVAPLPVEVTVRAWGAQGGGSGGQGGYSEATFALAEGTELGVYVGGQGATGGQFNGTVDSNDKLPGGYNGGGTGGYASDTFPEPDMYKVGHSGGGGSDVRIGGSGLADRIVVAGGGGGTGGGAGTFGGAGGGAAGQTGGSGTNTGAGGGGGGTSSAGGAGGNSSRDTDGTAGALGVGGDGGIIAVFGDNPGAGGGGGGGYYGGGGGGNWNNWGEAGGGGGGSGFVHADALTGSTTQGGRTGHGRVEIEVDGQATVFDYTGAPQAYVVPSGPAAVSTAAIVLQLEVTDSGGLTDTDTVTITVEHNEPPTANAGPDQDASSGDLVQLDGSGSSDPEGALTYAWVVLDADGSGLTTGDITGAATATPSFTAPDGGTFDIVLQLTVTDQGGLTDTDTVAVSVAAVLIEHTMSGGVEVGGAAVAEYITPDTVTGAGGVLLGGAAVVEDGTFDILADVTMVGGALAGGAADASFLSFEVHEPPAPAARLPVYELVLVARVPALTGVPELVVVDRLVTEGFAYTDELNRPGSAQLGCPIRSLSSAAKERLANLAQFPSEVWIYRDDELAWAGEVQTLQIQGQTLNLNCAGLLGYTRRMGVTADLTYTQVDQFTIAKGLLDHWQNLPQGHYGIDTSGITTSGVLRDRTYLRDELHNIGQRLEELGAVDNGFDMHVDPATRALVLSYPQRGLDLTASVFFDERNIDSAAVALSVGPDDLVTDLSATGTTATEGGENTVTYSARENVALRATYGRSWAGQNFSNVSIAETVQGHGDAYLDARDGVMFQPGVTIVPRPGADVGDFEPGDTISYSYDAGLGLQSGEYRVSKVTVSVASSGEQRIGVEFT